MSFFKPTCSDCVYLGSITTDRKYDLYCHQNRLLVACYGNTASDQTTFYKANKDRPEFVEALRLATAKGIAIEVPGMEGPASVCISCSKWLVFSCRQLGTGYCHQCAHKELARRIKAERKPEDR